MQVTLVSRGQTLSVQGAYPPIDKRPAQKGKKALRLTKNLVHETGAIYGAIVNEW